VIDLTKFLRTVKELTFSLFISFRIYASLVLPTSGKLFQPNQPKNSATEEKFLSHILSVLRGTSAAKNVECIYRLTSQFLQIIAFYLKNTLQKCSAHFSAIFDKSAKI
jgi:hypothetical protein